MTEKDGRIDDRVNCPRELDQDDEINLLELWQVVWKRRKLIYIVPQADDPVNEARGCLPAHPSLSKELLDDRKRERNI